MGLAVGDGLAGVVEALGAAVAVPEAVAEALGAAVAVPEAVARALGLAEAEGEADGGTHSSSGDVVPVSSRFFTMRWAS